MICLKKRRFFCIILHIQEIVLYILRRPGGSYVSGVAQGHSDMDMASLLHVSRSPTFAWALYSYVIFYLIFFLCFIFYCKLNFKLNMFIFLALCNLFYCALYAPPATTDSLYVQYPWQINGFVSDSQKQNTGANIHASDKHIKEKEMKDRTTNKKKKKEEDRKIYSQCSVNKAVCMSGAVWHLHRVNKCHPRVRWPGRAGPSAGSLGCASSRSRCCSPAPHSRPRWPAGCCGPPPGTGERTPGTPAHTHTHTHAHLSRLV